MNLVAIVPWEVQLALGLAVLAGFCFLAFSWFGPGVARAIALWGAAAAFALALLSRAFQKGQSHEIDRANRAADAAIRKAREARAGAERDALGGRLRDDDGFQRRD